jgi:hypothetical protein
MCFMGGCFCCGLWGGGLLVPWAMRGPVLDDGQVGVNSAAVGLQRAGAREADWGSIPPRGTLPPRGFTMATHTPDLLG